MTEDFKGRIGKLIRDARTHRGLTQQQLAERLQTSQSAVNRIEKGHQNLSLEMVARVNGEESSRGSSGTMHHSWDAIVAHAALNTRLYPGDILGSGTVGTGCILEHGDGRWLQRGDVVELEIEGIGVLRNRVAADEPAAD